MEWMEPKPVNQADVLLAERLPDSDREMLRANPGRWARFMTGEELSDARRSRICEALRKAGLEGRTVSVLDPVSGTRRVDVFARAPKAPAGPIKRGTAGQAQKPDRPASFRTQDLPVLEQVGLPVLEQVGLKQARGHVAVTFALPPASSKADVSMARINTAATLQATAALVEAQIATTGPNELKVNHEARTITVRRTLRETK